MLEGLAQAQAMAISSASEDTAVNSQVDRLGRNLQVKSRRLQPPLLHLSHQLDLHCLGLPHQQGMEVSLVTGPVLPKQRDLLSSQASSNQMGVLPRPVLMLSSQGLENLQQEQHQLPVEACLTERIHQM